MKSFAWLLLATLALAAQTSLAAPIPSGPIYTNKFKFRIPFHYDSDELKRLGAKEIRLFVSRDRGATWQQNQAVAPEAGKFNFTAQADGEYWFIVRTLDARNRLHPDPSDNDPGLQVIVDTAPPKLQLDLRQTAPGKVQLSWKATDDHLEPTQLRLEYVQPGTPDWTTLGVVPKASGTQEWAIPQGGVVSVRGSISDLGKNSVQDQVTRRIEAGSQVVPRPRNPEMRQPVAGSERGPREADALTMSERFPGSGGAANRAPEQVASKARTESTSTLTMRRASDGRGAKGSLVSQHYEEFPTDGSDPSESASSPAPAADSPTSTTPAARRRVVNTRKFQIGYKLQDVDAQSIDAVELYITPDGGATWYRYGIDDDKQSPAQIEVPREGTYGFSLGIRTPDGQSTDVPRNGDPPALEVVVDQTAPEVQLLPPKQGRGTHAHKILVSWTYADEFPADQPVALFYAATPKGPWMRISDWIENTGRYVWVTSPGVPARFYLRIEARDQAGNEQASEPGKPFVMSADRPTARKPDQGHSPTPQ
ncbi:MAG: hypothetical protein ACKV0T_13555 [Planctomycetales bacterium]